MSPGETATHASPAPSPWSWRSWLPEVATIDRREALRIALGVSLGLLMAGGATRLGGWNAVWLVAPMGASAVLVFGLPSSPLAQPWAVVAGNTLSALAGIIVVRVLPLPLVAAALAVGLAILAMTALRCLHPPGGACALLCAVTPVHDWHFALVPVLLNSALLVAVAVVYNRLTGRSYPHVAPPVSKPARRFSDADIDAVLARHNALMHTARDEFGDLLEEAELTAQARQLNELRCVDIMSADPLTVQAGTTLPIAWALLREHQVKALPVVDAQRRVVGLVTSADFLRDARLDVVDGPDGRPVWQVQTAPRRVGEGPVVVGQIMSRRVQVARLDRSLADIVPIFSGTGHHHIPVVDASGLLVGILTQSDVVRALRRLAEPLREPGPVHAPAPAPVTPGD